MTDVRILLIEASKASIRSYAVDLLKSKHLVLIENKTSKAVGKIRTFAPDIIVLDAASMRTSGTRICHRLHQSCNTCKIVLEKGTKVTQKFINEIQKKKSTKYDDLAEFYNTRTNRGRCKGLCFLC